MKTEAFICVLCACLVTLEARNKRSDENTKDLNKFTFLSYGPAKTTNTPKIFNPFTFLSHGPTKTTEQGPEANHVNGSIYGQMTNHTSFNKTEDEWLQDNTQN